jgi:hypothetical protein
MKFAPFARSVGIRAFLNNGLHVHLSRSSDEEQDQTAFPKELAFHSHLQATPNAPLAAKYSEVVVGTVPSVLEIGKGPVSSSAVADLCCAFAADSAASGLWTGRGWLWV